MKYTNRGKCTSNWLVCLHQQRVCLFIRVLCFAKRERERDKITLAVIARLSDLVHTIAKSPLQWSAGTRTHSRQIHRSILHTCLRSILHTCLHLDRFRIITTHVCVRARQSSRRRIQTRPDRLPLRYTTLRLLLCVALQSGGSLPESTSSPSAASTRRSLKNTRQRLCRV
jgi:hypothetical protein